MFLININLDLLYVFYANFDQPFMINLLKVFGLYLTLKCHQMLKVLSLSICRSVVGAGIFNRG